MDASVEEKEANSNKDLCSPDVYILIQGKQNSLYIE
jgi:hypothetical protein